jgi:hypothetical protein
MVASRKARRVNERVQTGRVQLDGLFVTPVGLFLSEVNWVGEFFQARRVLARPCFLPLGFRGEAAAPM